MTLVALALIAVTIAAGVATAGYAPRQYLVAAFAFELFAAIALTATAAFHLVLPRIGLTLPRILTGEGPLLVELHTGLAEKTPMQDRRGKPFHEQVQALRSRLLRPRAS